MEIRFCLLYTSDVYKRQVVTQCLMDHTDRGLRVKTRRGRGNTAVIDGLVFRNVEMRGVKAPFVINMFYFCDPDGHGPYVQSVSYTHLAAPCKWGKTACC